MVEKKLWAVVANGSSARILKNIGRSTGGGTLELSADHLPLGEIMADQAGRSFSSVGNRRSGMELKSDPVRHNERAFADRLLSLLERYRTASDIDSLIVIAAPQFLGDLRQSMPPQLKKIVSMESNKDLTGLSEKALYEAVDKLRQNRYARA